MLNHFTIINLPQGYDPLPTAPAETAFFTLKTCLRTLILDFRYPSFLPSTNTFSSFCQEVLFGEEAYIYVLEILCGLKSKILAENEIVGQFKEAYLGYLKLPNRNPLLIRILEKLLQDTKTIRQHYLIGISQKSYAYLARKILLKKEFPVEKVLLVGSGQLVQDLILQLKKWTHLFLTARNEIKMESLVQKYEIQSIPWQSFEDYQKFPHIICAVGAELILFDHGFFQAWRKTHAHQACFIDFGSPSTLDTKYQNEQGVYRLTDIFLEEEINQQQKMEQIHRAHKAIRDLVQERHLSLKKGLSLKDHWRQPLVL